MPPIKETGVSGNRQGAYAVKGATSYISRLVIIYLAWKLLLLLAVAASPGPGYDTSTRLFLHENSIVSFETKGWSRWLYHFALRLTRWDGVYFSAASYHGLVHEQQWAFSWALAKVTAIITDVLPFPHSLPHVARHALAGVLISFVSHLAAVIALYLLVLAILPTPPQRSRQIAFTTAVLHILSPGGVFLLAPYGESLYALLSTTGYIFYAYAIQCRFSLSPRLAQEALWVALAGVCLGSATMVRSNGLLNGILFAWDAAGFALWYALGTRSFVHLQRLAATVVGGSFVAIGFALPQYVAYLEYCTADIRRPWCANTPPSIYSWVQEHYWGVGFLKYWTFSNLPLFLLAAPVLALLFHTGYAALHHARPLLLAVNGEETASQSNSPIYQAQRKVFEHVLERLALTQILLAILAATSFHVQIINRISSGYPIWYLILAIAIDDVSPKLICGHSRAEHYYPFRRLRGTTPEVAVRGFIIYAIVQAGLYASFLPPA